MEEARHDRRDNMLIIGVVFAGTCLLASIFAWGMAARAESDARRVRATTAAAPAAATAAPPTIHLSEFQIQPATITVPADAALTVQNDGTMQHNLAVDGTSLATSMINPGGTAQLALTGLAPGSYTVYCQVPGHRDDGMHASLQVTAPTSGSGTSMNMGGQTSGQNGGQISSDQMDAIMGKTTKEFPAKTQGLGAQPLTPTILPDGTKQFDLTAKVVRW